MTTLRRTGIALASTATVAAAAFGLAGTAGATPTSSASGAKIKKAEIRVRKHDSVRMKVNTSRGIDKVTFTYAGETYTARRSHESAGEWKRTVDRDEDATGLAFTITACDGDDCVTKSLSGKGDRVRSGSDDGARHDAGDDKGGDRGASHSDDGPNHDAGDDKGGARGATSSDDGANHDAGDDKGGRHGGGGHGSDD